MLLRASVPPFRLPNLAKHMDEERYERENKEQVNQEARDMIDDVTANPREEQQKR